MASVGILNGVKVKDSTIRYIWKNEKAIQESAAASAVPSTKVVTHIWDVHIQRMEKALSVWIEDNVLKNMLLNGPITRTKAMRMYTHLAGTGGASTSGASTSDACTSTAIHSK